MSNELKEISLDGVKYLRADCVGEAPKPGKRAVVVLDRGWIVAGDVSTYEDEHGQTRLRITRSVHVRSWTGIGFDGMIAAPKSDKVIIQPMSNGFDCPGDSELFRVPVDDNWGL